MKKLIEPIKGYVDYEGVEHPFFYENQILHLFPSTVEEQQQKKYEMFSKFGSAKWKSKNEWIENLSIVGKTESGYNIQFVVNGLSSNNNGFIMFDSIYYYVHESPLYDNNIGGFYASGPEINMFYPPNKDVEILQHFDGNNVIESNISVKAPKATSLGIYNYKNIDIKISVISIPVLNIESNRYLITNSSLRFIFSELVNIEYLIEVYFHLKRFLTYISRNKSNNISVIDVIHIDESGLRNKRGRLEFSNETRVNKNENKHGEIISYEVLNEKTADLFEVFSLDHIYLEQIPGNYEKRKSYNNARMIANFTSFEREFRNIYNDKQVRSNEFYEIKNSILSYINREKEGKNRKTRDYYNNFHRKLERDDFSFAQKISDALSDCSTIMLPFLNRIYNDKFNMKNHEIGKRLNVLRNDMVHGNIDVVLLPIHTSDFEALEILVYVMRLKDLKIEDSEIMEGISKLFHINV